MLHDVTFRYFIYNFANEVRAAKAPFDQIGKLKEKYLRNSTQIQRYILNWCLKVRKYIENLTERMSQS